MQRFLKWLGNLIFAAPEKTPLTPDLRATSSHLRAAQTRRRAKLLTERQTRNSGSFRTAGYDSDSELGFEIEDGGPGKNVLRPKYVREESGSHETLRILDAELADGGEEAGFDPYNTGKFDRSANWSRLTRK